MSFKAQLKKQKKIYISTNNNYKQKKIINLTQEKNNAVEKDDINW